MRRFTLGLTAVLGIAVAADAVAAGPFRRVWERRRAELYTQLSTDLGRRMTSQVAAARDDLHGELETRIDGEAARLDAQFAEANARLRQQFDDEARQLDESLATGSARLEAASAAHLARIEQLVAEESRILHEQFATEAAAMNARFAADAKAMHERFESESTRLETRFTDALRTVREAADAHVARLDERMTTQTRTLTERGIAEARETLRAELERHLDERLAATAGRDDGAGGLENPPVARDDSARATGQARIAASPRDSRPSASRSDGTTAPPPVAPLPPGDTSRDSAR
jgi:hypothetical protein